MGKTELYLDYLLQEGFRAEIDSDGDIAFKFEGRSYYLVAHESDQMYFHLLHNGFWRISSAEELQRALLYANEATRETKVAKVYVNHAQTYACASVEQFYNEIEQFQPCLMRALGVLQHAVRDFCDKMRQSAPLLPEE